MTDEELSAIEARANAATAGPWSNGGDLWACVGGGDGYEVCEMDEVRAEATQRANAAFIASARSDVPALVAEVRRLKLRVAQLEWDHEYEHGIDPQGPRP